MQTPPRSRKFSDLLTRLKLCVESGHYKFTRHALERKLERSISLVDILYVLKNGYHENVKDAWDEQYRAWNYSIRGKNLDEEDLRIIVSFDRFGLLIITVIRLNKRGE